MKSLLLTLIGALSALTLQAQTPTTISGRVLKPTAQDTLFIYDQSKLSDDNGYDTLSLDKKGCFTYTANITQMSEISLFYRGRGSADGDAAVILLEPGKNVQAEVTIKGQGNDTKMSIAFKGKNVGKQVYANQFYQHFSRGNEFAPETLVKFNSLSECKAYVDEKMSDMNASVVTIKDDAEFVKAANNAIESYRSNVLFEFAIEKEKAGVNMEKDADFMAFVNGVNFNDTLQLSNIISCLKWRVTKDKEKYGNMGDEAAMIAAVREYSQNADVRNQVAGQVIYGVFFMMMYGADPADPSNRPVYEQYLLTGTDPQYIEFCNTQLKNMAVTAQGNLPVDFPLADADGKEYSFAGLIKEGTVTYFDFWATWCGPCKREIPHLAELVKEYKGNDKVRIISISIDADKAAWKKMIAADKPEWEQYIVPDLATSKGIQEYNISSIPRFMLFGMDGRIVSGNAKRPSDPELKAQIEQLLKGTSTSQEIGQFYIHGQLEGLKKGVNIAVLRHEKALDFDAAKNNAQADAFEGAGIIDAMPVEDGVIAEAEVQEDGRFELRGTIDRPQLVTLVTNNLALVENQNVGKNIPNEQKWNAIHWSYTPIFLENADYTIGTNKYELLPNDPITDDCVIQGGQAQEDFNEYNLMLMKESASGRGTKELDMRFIDSHPTSVVSVYLANNILADGTLTTSEIDHLASAITACPSDPKRFQKYVEQIQKTRLTAQGAPVVDLEVATSDGTVKRLVDVIPSGKIVLVDFWASWCGICRAGTPKIKELYNKYSRSEFDVISVSCDQSLDRWNKAMEKDQMPWSQFVLTKQGYSDFFAKYQTSGVPYLLLVDASGKVISNPGSPEKVEAKLQELMGGK